ncbi:MAG TPA: CopD family protein [Novosphingobium sp.]|nr:CopD family protein [Novosphingobium sp.]
MEPDLYLWVKAAHVAAVLIFIGGMVAVGVSSTILPLLENKAATASRAIGRWNACLTIPALAASWVLGLILAMSGNWFAQAWLQAKLLFVLLMTGLHAIHSARLRRIASGEICPAWRTVPLVAAVCIAIAGLVVLKPDW